MIDLRTAVGAVSCLLLVVTTIVLWRGTKGFRIGLRLAYAAFPASQLVCALTIFVWAQVLDLPLSTVLIASVAVAGCCPVDVVLFRRLKQAQRKEIAEAREAMLAQQLDATMRYNAELERDMDRVRGIRENAEREVMHVARMLEREDCDPSEAFRAIDGIRRSVGGTALRHCDNHVTDVVAEVKRRECVEAGIDVELALDVPRRVDGVSDIELTAVFGNLLDNGMAAALAAKEAGVTCGLAASDGSRPFVSLASETRGSILAITMRNSFAADVAQDSAENASCSGRLRDHGWGLSIVEAIAKRHAGVLSTERRESVFETTVLLMMEGE